MKKDVVVEEMDIEEEQVSDEDVSDVKEKKVSSKDAYLENLRKAKLVSQKAKDDFKKSDYKMLRNDAYADMDCVVSMIKHGIAIGGIIYSKGGLGKSFRMKQLLKDTNYEIIMTKLTAKAMYCLLYEYRNSDIIWFDDVTNIMKDSLILGFMKSACGDGNSQTSKTRTIQYNVSTPIKDSEGNILPDNFELTARILITTNEMPSSKKNIDLGAVLSRLKKAKLEISRVELLKIFAEIVKSPYGDLSLSEREVIAKFIGDNTRDNMKNLNLRLLFDGFDYYRVGKLDGTGDQWKVSLLNLLERDSDSVFLEGLLQDPNFFNEADRMDAFNEYLAKAGKSPVSKPTYYRKKNKLIEEQGIIQAPYREKPTEEAVVEQ